MLSFVFSLSKELDLNDLHIALLSYIKSKIKNENFFLIIDDFHSPQEENSITLDILKKFSIDTEEKIYRSENKNIYYNMALRLIQEKKAFPCFCQKTNSCECKNLSQEKIEQLKKEKSFVVKVNALKATLFDTIEGKKEKELDDFIILNKEFIPSKAFAYSVESIIYDISEIIKLKEETLESFQESAIRTLLDYSKELAYTHIPKILNVPTLKELLEEGIIPDAIINYLLESYIDKEIFYLPEAIEVLKENSLSNFLEKFDKKRLLEFNKKHLLAMDSKKLSSVFSFADSAIGEFLKLYLQLDSINTINDLEVIFKKVFSVKNCSKKQKLLASIIFEAPMIESFEEFMNYLQKQAQENNTNNLKEDIRLLLTGDANTKVSLENIYSYLKPYLLEVVQCQS